MSIESKPDELTIHAYFDGELSVTDAADVEAWLTGDPAARREVEKWHRQKSALKSRFDAIAKEDIPAAIREALAETSHKSHIRKFALMAAGLALFALGGLSGWALNQADASRNEVIKNVAEQALNAHLIYVSEKLHPVEVEANKKAHLVKWLSNRLGYPVRVPDLTAQNFELIGGRLLPSEQGPAAQFMYEDQTGKRITLYIARNPSGTETSFQLRTEDQASSFFWLDQDLGYAIAGALGEDRLLALATLVYQQIEETE